jgi:hypothetical protein
MLGFITKSGRDTIAINGSGKIVGVYSPITGLTKDGNLRVVSIGNSVTGQLFK